ncbi:MAG TPA: hypothetical protein PKY63_02505 [Bacteroidales bacterium]|nr:hypothetical protein [Bacteroidales bacterium]
MDKIKFRYHLDEATKQLIVMTKTLCYNDFSDNYNYILTPNLRTVDKDDKHLNEKEISVLNSWNKFEGKLLTATEVVDLFHHDNKVPVWIDMTVYEARPDLTVIDLFCSRRLREEKELMHQGLHPFHVQVATPPDSLKVEIDGKFDVNWKKKRDDHNKKGGF